MLRPKKKLTRKEIKRDPLLETTYKVRKYYDANRTTIVRYALIIVVVVVVGLILIGRNRSAVNESQTALDRALIAYAQNDLESARFQFETLYGQYPRTRSGKLAAYYIGKIYFENHDYSAARTALESFVKKSQFDLLTSTAYTMLATIAEDEGDIAQAIVNIKAAVKNTEDAADRVAHQVHWAELLLVDGKDTQARQIVADIIADDALTATAKGPAEELAGRLQVLEDRR